METFLRQNWTLKLEYRFSQFGEETILDSHHISADLEPSMHTARLILSYRFGHHDSRGAAGARGARGIHNGLAAELAPPCPGPLLCERPVLSSEAFRQ